MSSSNGATIKADLKYPQGRGMVDINGHKILAYNIYHASTGKTETKGITRHMFSTLSEGVSGFPPLVKIKEMGGNKNVAFFHMWVQADGTMKWKIGQLLYNKTFEEINWQTHTAIPGSKNKGIGCMNNMFQQGLFEGAGRWIKKLEQNDYKLLFPSDEIVGNQLYFMRSSNTDILTNDIDVPWAMLATTCKHVDDLPSGGVILEPKYDGSRALATLNKGQAKFFSRNKNENTFMTHLVPQIKIVFDVIQDKIGNKENTCQYWLDGELYRHGWVFQKTISAVKRSVNQSLLSPEIVYMVYDLIDDCTTPMLQRRQFLQLVFDDPRVKDLPNVKLTYWEVCNDYTKINEAHVRIVTKDKHLCPEGEDPKKYEYEGTMIRTLNGFYKKNSKTSRSKDLLKFKDFKDEEWWITGVEEATGTHIGCAKYVLNSKKDGTGLICRATPAGPGIGDLESRKRQLENKHLFIGSMVTIKFQEKSIDGVPRFPNIIAFNRPDM